MSASPAQSGPNSVAPGTAPKPLVRKRAPVNIFNTSKKSSARNGTSHVQRKPAPARAATTAPAPPAQPRQQAPTEEEGEYEDFPIMIKRHALEAGMRFHALKLQTKVNDKGATLVDPTDEKQFTRPLRLHRRYARDKIETGELSDVASGADDKEREQMNARRAERQAEREENQKLIAPTGGESSKPNKKKPQKKVEEGRDDSNPIRKRRQQLRYEEARPWHLEDFESKNIWVGSYEDALSERSIMLELVDCAFRMVPVEKWYKFIQTNKVNTMTAEEVEKHLTKKVSIGRWAMGTQKGNEAARREQLQRVKAERRAARDEDDDRPAFFHDGEFQADKDMLDMEYNDEFQDDDEGMLFQGEDGEDGKEIEQRLWLEMRDAGLSGTGVKNDDIDPEEEERKRQEKEEAEKKDQRKIRKQLLKRENKGEYLSDDDSLFSSDDDSDEDRRKKEEEQKNEDAKKQLNGDKSGASTGGTNTPSGRPEKRPNPDLSDLSGDESSRKKAKTGPYGTAVSTTGPSGARSLSPDTARVKHKMSRLAGGSGSGSDTDTSRVGRPKLKLKNSPPGSRATSPSATGSRAQSPKPNGMPGRNFPTLDEVRAAIPPAGIEIKVLVSLFKAQVAGRSNDFITLVKTAGVQDKASGKIMPKA